MAQNKFQPCRLCSIPTPVVVNINFKAVPVCEGCCTSIFLQQAQWYAQQDYSHLYKPELTPAEKAVMDRIGPTGNSKVSVEIYRIDKPTGLPKPRHNEVVFSFVYMEKGKMPEVLDDSSRLNQKVVKSLIDKGLIRQYNTSTNQHGTYTYYKKI